MIKGIFRKRASHKIRSQNASPIPKENLHLRLRHRKRYCENDLHRAINSKFTSLYWSVMGKSRKISKERKEK